MEQHQCSVENQTAAALGGGRAGQQVNRYAHLVSGQAQPTATATAAAAPNGRVYQRTHPLATPAGGTPPKFSNNHAAAAAVALVTTAGGNGNHTMHTAETHLSRGHSHKPPSLRNMGATGTGSGTPPLAFQREGTGPGRTHYYTGSFSNIDWRDQWVMLKEKTLERVADADCQRKLIMLIVCTALLLDNMLYMVIVPIIPDYLRSIGAWSTYTENAKWIRRNSSRGRTQWEQVGGQTIYEGEDSAVGFLFASKAIVQLIANPFSGAIADRIGYEIPMMFGLIVMFLSTMVFACGQTYSVLFLARSLQGVGSAFADTPGIAMLADRFTEEKERRRAQGIAIAFISFGCLVAPPFGSILYQGAGKEVPFIILSLVCLVDGSLLLLVAPPGTFSQIWPGYKQASCYGGGSLKSPAVTSPPPPPSPQQHAQVTGGQQQIQSIEGGPFAEQTTKQRPAGSTTAALKRQKSISRRHSITISAGEAPKGTPIEVLLRDPCIACCAGALVVANISLAFLEPTISIWVKNTMPGTEEWQEGLIWLPAFFPHVLGVFATLHFAEKYPQCTWKIATSGLLIEGLGCLVVPFCSSFWSLIIPISVICFGVALIDTAILPTLGFLVDTRFTSVYGNVYAIADISYSLSYAVGPIIAGGIVEAIGFTALNFLIAAVTLGYTPVLMMLRTIRDYEPFEADQTGLAADRAKPFGQFGRAPLTQERIPEEEEEEEADVDEDDDEDDEEEASSWGPSQLQLEQQQAGATQAAYKYEAPAWAATASQQHHQQYQPDLPAASAGSFKRSAGSASGANKPTKSVKIVEESTIADEPQQPQQQGNPFLAHQDEDDA